MSAWTGVVIAAVAIAVIVVAVGQPAWEWRLSDTVQVETWSYGLFGVTHTIVNKTYGNTTVVNYTYADLPNQGRMAALFGTIQEMIYGILASAVAALSLSIVVQRRKLRGAFPGAAMVVGALLSLGVPIYLVLGVATAADDLPRLNGNSLPGFEGQITTANGSVLLNWGPNVSWYLLLGLCLLLAFGASEIWSLQPARKAAVKPAAARAATPPPPKPLAHPEPVIEEVFVIGSNGLLIKHMSRTLMSDKDRDVVGGMISVLSNFVRETFSERDGSDVQEVTLGDHRFLLCNERGIVVAVLVTRGATEDIVPRLRHLLACLIDRYADKLDSWGGEPLEGIEDEIQVLWQPFFLPPPPTD